MLNEADQLGGSCGAQCLGILAVGGEVQNPGKMDAVVANGGDVLRNPQPGLPQGVETADIGVIVGEKDAGGPLRQLQQRPGVLRTPDRIVVARTTPALPAVLR